MHGDFSEAALVLVGHGSLRNAESSAPIHQHAEELRRRGLFAQVLEGFWKLEPGLAGVLRGVFAPRVFIVPIFISEGYFTDRVVPRELGLCGAEDEGFDQVEIQGERVLYYTGPVGTHPAMAGVILARAGETVERHPFPRAPKRAETALIIAGHGTGSHENSRQAIEAQAERIRTLGDYAEVHAVFLEEDPRVGSVYDLARSRNLVVVPFFISDGLHSWEQIPVLLGEPERVVRQRLAQGQPTWRNPTERLGKRVWYGASVGSDPRVADVILERVREAAGWRTAAAPGS